MPARSRALVVGRFQPFHLGHLEVLKRVAEGFTRVTLAIGSAQESHSRKNPFTAGERFLMIEAALEEAGVANVDVLPLPDLNRNALWVRHVESLVPPFQVFFTNNALPKRLFEESGYEVRPLPFVERGTFEGTRIRELMEADDPAWEKLVPPAVARVVRELGGLERMRDLLVEDRVR